MSMLLMFKCCGERHILNATIPKNTLAIALVPQVVHPRNLVVQVNTDGVNDVAVYASLVDSAIFNSSITDNEISDPVSMDDWDLWTPGITRVSSSDCIEKATAIKIVSGNGSVNVRALL